MAKINKKWVIILATVGAIVVGGFLFFGRDKNPNYEFITVKKGNLIQEVSVTGKVRPAESVDLGFEKGGKILAIYAKVGDNIKEGALLAILDVSDIVAQLAQAKAGLDSVRAGLQQYQAALDGQIAKLDELKKGTRTEEIAVKESELAKAKQDLANYYKGIEPILSNSYNKANDAVIRQTDEMFSDDFSNSPQLTFLTTRSQLETNAEWQRVVSGSELVLFKSEIDNLSSVYDSLDTELKKAKNHLEVIKFFLINLEDAVNYSAGLAQSTVNTYKSNLNAARTNVIDAITSIDNQEQLISVQKITVEKTQNELNLKLAGSTAEQIASQEAQVKQAEANIFVQEAKIEEAEANVQNYEAQIEKAKIRAPIEGVIIKQDAKIGEIISANEVLISVISEMDFEIEANVPEADIAKIKMGDSAKVTLDAYSSNVIFEAKIVKIEPAETIIEGVATYKTILQFINGNGRIRSGMTANIDVLADSRENIIVIPQRAVIIKNGQEFARIIGSDGLEKEITIKTGLRGSDGNIEIIEGISEGDSVIIFIKSE